MTMTHPHVTNELDLAGATVVAIVDFHETTIIRVDAAVADQREHITPEDPRGLSRNVYHRKGNPDGVYEADNEEYWRTVGHALAPADQILLLGNGKGKANASHHLVAWLEKHMSDVAAKLVADVRANLSALTDEQILRMAQTYFGEPPARDHADSQRGAP
jgi:hypothetical protein